MDNKALQINGNDSLVLFGSCFSDNIYKKLRADKMKVLSNPFGVIFHPIPLFKLIIRALNNDVFNENDFFKIDNYWFCDDMHGSMAKNKLDETIESANEALNVFREYLTESKFLFLTLGTSWAYAKSGEVVANCHKQKASEFEKELSSQDEIYALFEIMWAKLQKKNPALNLCFTVSPVRHYKDGLVNNQRSKSVLNLFCHQAVEGRKNVSYFPSYEFVIDELRDYVFFKEDKVHPNELAIGRVYEYFKQEFFSGELKKQIEQWNSIQKMIKHKSIHPFSTANLNFKLKVMESVNEMEERCKMDLSAERALLSAELTKIESNL